MTEAAHEDIELAVQMRELLYGQLVSRALCAAAALDVPNILARGRSTVEEVAAKSGAHPKALHQLLRALVPFGVLVEHADASFELTPLGATLRSDAVASAMPTAMLVHGEVGRAWHEFLTTVQTGEPAFDRVYGTDFFTHLDHRPELHAVFHESQQHGLTIDLDGILRHVDFTGRRVLVDIGGGDGALLAAVLAEQPEARGILVDLPTVIAKARLRFAAAGLAGRTELYGGDFLAALPAGGDLYMMRQITHDLDDARAAALLASCHRAMAGRDATLLIMDLMADELSDGLGGRMTAIMNLYMLSIFGGHERTRAEFERLLVDAGFAVESVTKVAGQMTAITARAV